MSILVLGSINRDIICRVDALPRAGETVRASRTVSLPGGKGANQAIAAARMGAAVRMIGCVGDDEAGTAMIDSLADANVAVDTIARIAGVPTGTAYITTSRDGENQIVVDPGANAHLLPDALPDAAIAGARVVLAQLETPVAATLRLFEAAAGAIRILNTAPALDEAALLFPHADLLIFNQIEVAHYLGLATPPTPAETASAVRRLLARDGQRAVVTLGGDGALLVDRDTAHHAPGLDVPAVDTTGAGDCFCGALAAGLVEGMAAADALPVANVAASLCVQAEGAAPAMPTRAALSAAQQNGRGGSRSPGAPAYPSRSPEEGAPTR